MEPLLRVNRDLSRQLAEHVQAKSNRCFQNALQGLASLTREEALYVEGFMVVSDNPEVVTHGWIEWGGEVIDPTHIDPPALYFPVGKYSAAYARTIKSPPIMIRSPGSKSPVFQDALFSARQHIGKQE